MGESCCMLALSETMCTFAKTQHLGLQCEISGELSRPLGIVWMSVVGRVCLGQ